MLQTKNLFKMSSTDEIPSVIDLKKLEKNLINNQRTLQFKDEIKVPRVTVQDVGHVLGEDYEMITIDRMPLGNNLTST